jgi:hypothetical protein
MTANAAVVDSPFDCESIGFERVRFSLSPRTFVVSDKDMCGASASYNT